MYKKEELKLNLDRRIRECTACRLHLTRNKTVPGCGSLYSKEIFLGEAPGRIEDETGIPFNNQDGAGKVFNALLYNSGYKRNEIYVTNPVKCRPPNNRVPDPDELEACRGFLDEEIEIVNPDIIAALGEVASLISTGKTLRHRGFIQIESYLKKPVLITYHPAYFTYGAREDMFNVTCHDLEKMKQIKEIIEKGDPQNYLYNPPSYVIKEKLERWRDEYVAVDIETSGNPNNIDSEEGLDPFSDEIVGIAFCGSFGDAFQLDKVNMEANWNQIKDFLESHSKLIFQNNRFDRAFLKVRGINSKLKWDAFTAMYLLNPSLSRKLDFTRSLYTNKGPYKSKDNYRYHLDWLNCRDVDVTREVGLKQMNFTNKALMERVNREDDLAIKMRVRGVKISEEAIAAHYIQIQPKIEALIESFEKDYNVNLNSPKQISRLLYDELSLPAYRGKRSTDEEQIKLHLDSLIGNPPERKPLEAIRDYREIQRIASTYCEGIYKRIKQDGRVHPEWLPTGTDTGRWSCHNPSLMNTPLFMRDIAVADEGKVFMALDYSKMQVWGAAILSDDLDLIEVLKDPKRSIHKEVLQAIEEVYLLTKTVGYDQALLRAKAVVFGTIFGRTAEDIANEFKVDKIVAKIWQEQYLNRFHKMRDYLKKVVEKWKKNGYVDGIYGRRKYAKKATEAMNHPVQNFEAEVVINAMFALDEAGFNLIITVHDQLLCEEDLSEKTEERFKEMEAIMNTASKDIYPYFPVAGAIGKNWLEVK